MKTCILLLGLAFATSAAADCDLSGKATATAVYVSSSANANFLQVAFCQRGSKTNYVEFTVKGFPGALTYAEELVYGNTIETVDGINHQFITAAPDSVLAKSLLHVLIENPVNRTLEIREDLGANNELLKLK